jgi:hypothetical protein
VVPTAERGFFCAVPNCLTRIYADVRGGTPISSVCAAGVCAVLEELQLTDTDFADLTDSTDLEAAWEPSAVVQEFGSEFFHFLMFFDFSISPASGNSPPL